MQTEFEFNSLLLIMHSRHANKHPEFNLILCRIGFACLCLAIILPLSSYSSEYSDREEDFMLFWCDLAIFILWCLASYSMYPVSSTLVILSNIFLFWWMISTHYGWIKVMNSLILSMVC